MKKIAKFIIALILVFCINNNAFSQEEKDWEEINSYDNLEGEWEGNAISFVKNDIFDTEFESTLKISMTFSYKKGDKIVSSFVKIDFTDFLTDLENINVMKENGFTKEIIWEMFKEELGNRNLKFNQYSISFENSGFANEYFASDSEGKFLINKNKDTLLLIYYEPSLVFGIGDSGFTRMIFKKILKSI